MTNLEFFTNICQSVLNPLPTPITEQEKEDILSYERDMEEIMAEEDWPPYDIAMEL